MVGSMANSYYFRFSLATMQRNIILIREDNLKVFIIIEEVCKLPQISKFCASPYYPQGGGLVERANRTILKIIATVVKDHHNRESCLRATCVACNTSIQSTTGYSPFL